MRPDADPTADPARLQERIVALEYERQSSREQVEAAQVLTEIAVELAATLDPAQVTPRIVSAGCRLLHGRLCTLYRLDPASGSLTCVAVAGDLDPQRWIGHRLPAGAGVAARAIAARAPVVVPDMLTDPEVVLPEWLRERARAENLRAVTAVPLVSRGEPVGALVVADEAGRVPGAEALPLLTAFAAQAAIALDNARLYSATQLQLAERIRTEETLARYRFLADQAHDIVLCLRRDGRILEANRAAVTAYGYSPQELLSLTILDLRAPETQPLTQAQMAQADAEGILFETVHRRKDGSTFPVEVSSRGTALGGERVLVSIIRDISTRKQAQVALAAQLERLEAVRAVTVEITRELDLPALLDLIVRRAVDLAGADSGVLRLWDEDAQLLVPVSWTGFTEEPGPFQFRLGEGVAGEAARRRGGLIVNDFRHSPYATSRLLDLTSHVAVLAEPLVFGDRLVGVLSVSRKDEGTPFTEESRETLSLFAGQATIAIENARLHTAAIRRGRELEALLGATRSLMSGLDLQGTLHRIVTEASRMAGTPHVSVMLVDKTANTLQVAAQTGDPMPAGFTIPLGMDLSGIVAQTGEPLSSPDTPNDPRSLLAERDRGLGLLSYLGLPIKVRSEVLGVLTFDTTTPRRFTPQEITYLTSFADQAAIALENARLYAAAAHRAAELAALQEVGQAITARLELPAVLEAVVAGVTRLLGNPFAQIILWDEDGQSLRYGAAIGPEAERVRAQTFALGRGINGVVAATRQPMVLDDYQSSPYVVPECADVVATITVPILFEGRLLGVLHSHTTQAGRRFSLEELHQLRMLADQAAIAIENARLHGAAVRREEELRALLRATSSAMSGPDLQTILDRIVEEAAAITRCAHVKLMLVDQETQTLRPGALKGTTLPPDFQMPVGRGLSGRVAASGEPLFVSDPGADPENVLAQADRDVGVATYLGLPVKTGDRVLGVLTFNTTTPHTYSGDELAYLGSFASQAAIAIEKAELLREEQSRRQQLEAIEAISAEMTRELDLPRLLDIIARRARELVGATACAVWLWNEADSTLSVQAWSGHGEGGEAIRLRLGEGVTGEAARRREGLIVNDYRSSRFAHPHFLAWAPHRTVLAEPLLYRDRLLGVIAMDHLDGEQIFRVRDRHVLRLLAAHAVIAIENARLFAELSRSYRELQRAQDELIQSEKLRALGQLAAGVAHDLNNILAAVLGQAQLLRLRIPDRGVQEALATLENAATDGAHIVRRLQDFARRRARSELAPMDLAAAVQEALEITRPRWRDEPQRRGHVIAITTALEGLPAILGHPAEVREAVTNLILNAVDAMPRGGTLTFSGRRAPRETGRDQGPAPAQGTPASGPAAAGDEWVELTIADTGTGMSEEVRGRIFEPFFTTKGVRGSGLGLSVVYGIMERHGGQIALETALGQGTRVTLRFQAAASPVPTPRTETAAASTPLRVLLVDDDPAVRQTVGSLLRTIGHQTVEADGGAAGILRLGESAVDLVVTDLGMPEVTGWDVARAAKAHDPRLPVILLTGWGDQIVPDSSRRGLVDRILGKPFRLEELRRAIAELQTARSATGRPE